MLKKLHEEFERKATDLGLAVHVLPSGTTNARVVIIGEGPGETEARTGIPWTGGAGKLLWNSLRKHNLHQGNTYATNVVKRQISLSRRGNERHQVSRPELSVWFSLLEWELQQLPNVEVIFALGNYALEAITKTPPAITKWRGSVMDYELPNKRKVKVLFSINPAYALRELVQEPMFLMDTYRLDQVVRGAFEPYKIEKVINPTFREAKEYIKKLTKSKKPYSFDIEFMNLETVCFGLSDGPNFGFCINLRDRTSNRFTVSEEIDLLLALQELFIINPRAVMQNGNFDTYWCWYKDYLRPTLYFDTLLAHHTLYPQLPHSLEFLTTQYTTHPYYKDERLKWREGGDIDRYWQYNATDCAITFAVYERLLKELQQQQLDKFFFNHVMQLAPHIARATVEGTAVDLKAREQAIKESTRDVNRYLKKFQQLVHEATEDEDYDPNPGSWQQLKGLFFERLNLKGRGMTTDQANRERMIRHPSTRPVEREMLTALNRWAAENKFNSTYAASRIDADARIRCEYKQFGVQRAPGRLSSSQTMWGSGQNLQNIPERARQQFIVDEGTVFIYFDAEQAEARIVAYRANIPKWKAQFERARKDGSYDAHRALASEMFKVPYEEVPEKDIEHGKHTIRYTAKRCRHGLNYRMEEYKLSEVTGLSYHDARRAFALYHHTTPELRPWWAAEEALFRREKALYNAFGRRLKVIQRIDEDVLRSIVAFFPQSTLGDKVRRVWYQCMDSDDWPRGKAVIRMNHHDALIGVATPKVAKTCLAIMKRYMEEPITIQDCYNNVPEKLIIPASLGMSKPDEHGVHRWSTIGKVSL